MRGGMSSPFELRLFKMIRTGYGGVMKTMMRWYTNTVKDDSVSAVARKSGVVQTTLNRHVNEQKLTAEEVIAIARAYGASAVRALVETGHLTDLDVAGYRRAASIDTLTDREIADEVWKRMVEGRLDSDGDPLDDGPALSVIADIDSGTREPVAALRSERNKEFEARENE